MTAKEKAKELVDKFKNRSIELGETHSQLMAEANALIAVDEIINDIDLLEHYKIDYWYEVKYEIEKM